MCQEGTSREYFSSRNNEWEIFKLIRTTDLILVKAPKWLDQAQALPVRHSLWQAATSTMSYYTPYIGLE